MNVNTKITFQESNIIIFQLYNQVINFCIVPSIDQDVVNINNNNERLSHEETGIKLWGSESLLD